MKQTIFLLLFFTTAYGQLNQPIYSVTVGKYKCAPDFYENKENSGGILSATDEGKIVSNPPIYFPKRTDTVIIEYPNKKIVKRAETKDHYLIECGTDSIYKNEIDSLINGEIAISNKTKRLKLLSYTFSVIYADGEMKSLTMNTKKININNDALALINKKNILFIGIGSIEFISNKGQKLTIGEGFGWKIINSR